MRSSLYQQVIQLAWPAVFQGLLTTIILFTDRLILGAYSDAALASMQVSGPILWSLFSLFGAYSIGVLALIGRAVGAEESDKVARIYGTALCIAIVLGSLVGVTGYLLTEDIATVLIGSNADTSAAKSLAETYLATVMLSGPILMIGSVTIIAFQASGDTKTPMWITFFSGAINLGMSWILVFGTFGFPQLGILGAAIGTVLSHCSNALLGLLLIRYKSQIIRFARPKLKTLRSIFTISWPVFGEKLLFHSGFLFFAGLIGRLGDQAMTAHQAMIAIEALGFIAAHAFSIAAATLVAQKLGAKKPHEAHEAAIISTKLSVLVLSAIGLLFFFGAEPLLRLFTQDPAVLAIGVPCMTIAAFSQPLMALTDSFSGVLRGSGDTKTPMKVALIGPLLVRPISCYFLAFSCGYGLWGIWIGSTLDWLTRSIWLYAVFRQGKWQKIQIGADS
ncbi:MAG: MATE family efflux transporter [Myxococcota bacterium]|nr:MATE family efflux transporter [Myxococcota bacterium]